jgi:N-acetylneuraminic acid mutarotase
MQDMQLPEARMNGAAVTDGHHIYIVGGISIAGDYSSGLRSVWSIDPEHVKEGWTRLPPFPFDPRMAFGASMLNKQLMLFGGLSAEGAEPHNLDDIWSYDTSTQTWSKVGVLPEPMRAMWAATEGNQVYLFGGYTNTFSSTILTWNNGRVTRFGTLPEPVADAQFFSIGCYWYTAGGETAIRQRGVHAWAGRFPAPCRKEKE